MGTSSDEDNFNLALKRGAVADPSGQMAADRTSSEYAHTKRRHEGSRLGLGFRFEFGFRFGFGGLGLGLGLGIGIGLGSGSGSGSDNLDRREERGVGMG